LRLKKLKIEWVCVCVCERERELENTYTIFKVWTLLEFLNFFPQLTDVACVMWFKNVEGLSKLVEGCKGAISSEMFAMNISYGNLRKSDC
jgi:hypothetical protein